MEQLDGNFLFRWFVGLNIGNPVWEVMVFSHNRDRLLKGESAGAFFAPTLAQAHLRGLLSDEHFTVDGTLIKAWPGSKVASAKRPHAGLVISMRDNMTEPA